MPENSDTPQISTEQLRHDIANAIGALQTAVNMIRPVARGVDEAFVLHEAGMDRLRKVLAILDRTQQPTGVD